MKRPISLALCVTMCALVVVHTSLYQRPSLGQAIGSPNGPLTNMIRGTGSPSCYFCPTNASPAGWGCQYGNVQPPYTSFGLCTRVMNPSSTCTDQQWQCGPYFLCAPPYTQMNYCYATYYASF